MEKGDDESIMMKLPREQSVNREISDRTTNLKTVN